MATYKLTINAIEDLTGIWDYSVGKWSENQAEKYYNQLLEFCKSIAEKPSLGKHYPQVSEDLYGYLANLHIIFYNITGPNQILIIRILHSSMDLKSKLSK